MIEITLKCGPDMETDLAVNEWQPMKETLRILAENRLIFFHSTDITRLYSARRNEFIDSELSYQEAGIYNGDILSI